MLLLSVGRVAIETSWEASWQQVEVVRNISDKLRRSYVETHPVEFVLIGL